MSAASWPCWASVSSRALGVGAIAETVKRGDPAHLPPAPRVGTTLRINGVKGDAARYALYFHCRTSLRETFGALYPATFRLGGRRAILFDVGDRIPRRALRHCVALALPYHLRSRGGS